MATPAVERPDISRRPSLTARLQLLGSATTTCMVRDERDDTASTVAEWFMARARHQFQVALWADDARFGTVK